MEVLKQRLNIATKEKIIKEKDLRLIHNKVLIQIEEITCIQNEIEHLNQQLRDMQGHIIDAQQQLTIVNMCKMCEEAKIKAHIQVLNEYKKCFYDLFEKEKATTEKRFKELEQKQKTKDEQKKQKHLEALKLEEQQWHEVEAIEKECDDLERECIVLKKRNTAIMLKLRRKLIETEDTRRMLRKK